MRQFSLTPRVCDPSSTQAPQPPPDAEAAALHKAEAGPAPTYLGTAKRLPEFNLVDKVVLVSGAARGLGLVQAEALLEAGATGMSKPAILTPSHKGHQRLQNWAESGY
jgi:hypothetical protein